MTGHARVAAVALLVAACAAPGASRDPTFGNPIPTTQPPSPSPGATGSPAPTPGATPAPTIAAPSSGTWARIEASGPLPAAREDHTWTLDEAGEVAYLFGGRGGGEAYGDLWRFDLAAATWSRVDVSGRAPAPRFGHEAAWLPGRGLVVTLGQSPSSFFDDIWLFDPAARTWRELPSAGARPVARYGSCSGVGPDGRLWISHGFTEDGIRFSDTLAYDLAAQAWADETPLDGVPRERCLQACWWTADGSFVLYGGQTTGVAALGDLWVLAPGTGAPGQWREVPDPGPAARQLAATGRLDGLTVLFGGAGVDRRPLGDTWVLIDGEPGFREVATPGRGPSPRSGAALVADMARGGLLLFGGIGDGAKNDLWSLTLR